MTDSADESPESARSPSLASLRDVAAGLAHELRNPLQFIENYAEVVRELSTELGAIVDDPDAPLSAATADDLATLRDELGRASEQIVRHTRRLDAIVDSMLATSGGKQVRRELVDLNVLVQESAGFAFDGRPGPTVADETLLFDLDESIPPVKVDALRLSRAVVNLVTNALQAVGAGTSDGGDPTVTVRTHRREGGFSIVVEDNGPGIPDELRQRVFEPFFSARTGRPHAGLGLTQVWDIVVDEHGGSITLDSGADHPTTATITIDG